MKRILSAILAAALCLSLAGCKSKAERDLENLEKAAEEFRKAAEDAAKQYDEVKNDFDDYNRALERIQGK